MGYMLIFVAAHVTYRMLKRANIIMDLVKSMKVVDNTFTLQKVGQSSLYTNNDIDNNDNNDKTILYSSD